jgi:hypothetical protein
VTTVGCGRSCARPTARCGARQATGTAVGTPPRRRQDPGDLAPLISWSAAELHGHRVGESSSARRWSRARRGRRRVSQRRAAAANIAGARPAAGPTIHRIVRQHVHVRLRPGRQRPNGGVVVDLDEVSGAPDAGTEEPVVYGSPACVRQNSTAASVASKWVATGGLPRVVGPGQLWPPLITVA